LPDVIVLGIRKTSQDYVNYLQERQYDYLICGDEFVNYKEAFKRLGTLYNAKRITVDTGPTLSGILLKQKLIDEKSFGYILAWQVINFHTYLENWIWIILI